MRSTERSYQKIASKNPNSGAYICLAGAVKYRKFSRKTLVKGFKKLMPREEYAKGETKGLIDYLEYLTNIAEEAEI